MFTGQSDPDTLLSSLIMAHDQHQQVVEVDLKEEVRRERERRWRRRKIKQVLAYYHL